MAEEEVKHYTEEELKETCPVLPLRDIVVFPHMVVPLFVGREKSVRALDSVMSENKQILLLTQKTSGTEDPTPKDLYQIGTMATVLQLLRLPDGTVKVLVEGIKRAKIKAFVSEEPFLEAMTESVEQPLEINENEEINALTRTLTEQFERYVNLNKRIPPEAWVAVSQIQEPTKLTDAISSHLALKVSDKQKILETTDLVKRMESLFSLMEKEIAVLQVERKIRKRVKTQMEKSQKEYYLNEQIKAIQKELGGSEDGNDFTEYQKKINKTPLSKEAKEKANAELKKLRMMGPLSAEAGVIRNYLDWILCLPWKQEALPEIDLEKAQEILDKDHYGLEKVKERIIEHLAV